MPTKNILKIGAIFIAISLICSIVGCSSSKNTNDNTQKETENGTIITERLVMSGETCDVLFDEEHQTDMIVLRMNIENISDDTTTTAAAEYTIVATQQDNILIEAENFEVNGALAFHPETQTTELAPKETIEISYGWKLDSYEDITIKITSNDAIGETIMTFKPEATEPGAAAQIQKSTVQAYEPTTEKIISATVTVPGNYSIIEKTDNAIRIKSSEWDENAYIEIASSAEQGSAQQWAQNTVAGYEDREISIEDKTLANSAWLFIQPTDFNFMMFTDSASKQNTIMISGLNCSFEQAKSVIENVTIE